MPRKSSQYKLVGYDYATCVCEKCGRYVDDGTVVLQSPDGETLRYGSDCACRALGLVNADKVKAKAQKLEEDRLRLERDLDDKERRPLTLRSRPSSIPEAVWAAAVDRLADDAIGLARENVDTEYAVSMISHHPGPWFWDANCEGRLWTWDALVDVLGREPNEIKFTLWPGYLRSVYKEVEKILHLKVATFVKAKPMTAKDAKQAGLPDFKPVATKAIELAKKYARKATADFRGFAEMDAVDSIGDRDASSLIGASLGEYYDLKDLDPYEVADALVDDTRPLIRQRALKF